MTESEKAHAELMGSLQRLNQHPAEWKKLGRNSWRKRDPLDVVVEFLITYVLGFAVFLVKLSLGLYVLKRLGIL